MALGDHANERNHSQNLQIHHWVHAWHLKGMERERTILARKGRDILCVNGYLPHGWRIKRRLKGGQNNRTRARLMIRRPEFGR